MKDKTRAPVREISLKAHLLTANAAACLTAVLLGGLALWLHVTVLYMSGWALIVLVSAEICLAFLFLERVPSILDRIFLMVETLVNFLFLTCRYSRPATMSEFFFVTHHLDYIKPSQREKVVKEISARAKNDIYWSDYWMVCKYAPVRLGEEA